MPTKTLSDELRKSLLTIKNEPKTADGYELYRKTNYCGAWINHCGWYPETKLRLWHKDKARWQGAVHETLTLPPESIFGFLTGDLLHYSYPDLAGHVQKTNAYTTQAAAVLYQKGKKAPLWKIIAKPTAEFVKKYVLQAGFLDGYQGFVISVMSGYYKFLKFAKLRDLYRQNKRQQSADINH